MNLLTLIAEALFGITFVAVGWQFIRQPDALRAHVLLVFLPLTTLFVVSAIQTVVRLPPGVGIAAFGLLVAQPLFTILLVATVERVPRVLVAGIFGTTLLSLAVLVAGALATSSVATGPLVLVGVVFFVAQTIGAAYLFLAARRRRGAGAARFTLAAISTALIGVALLVAVLAGLAVPGVAGPREVAILLALVAGLGYLFAFFPPAPIRSLWQAGVMAAYGRSLVERADQRVASVWQGYAEFAHGLGGVGTVVLQSDHDAQRVIARSGLPEAVVDMAVPQAELDAARDACLAAGDLPVGALGPGLAAMAAAADASYAYVLNVDLPGHVASRGVRPATLVMFGRQRSLFGAPDAEVLTGVGIETAILAERSAVALELEDLNTRLATTVDAVRSASEAKSDFLASMSHELRTPLSAILGFSDLMRMEPAVGDSVTVPVEWVEHIHRGADHLLSLINDVLDLAKVEAGRVKLLVEPIDLDQAIAESLNGMRPLAERKHLAFG